MKFKITKEVRKRVREIVPEETTVIEIERKTKNTIAVYAIYKGIRIAEASLFVAIGDSITLDDVKFTIDWEDDKESLPEGRCGSLAGGS